MFGGRSGVCRRVLRRFLAVACGPELGRAGDTAVVDDDVAGCMDA
jgi:hypothetical protein